MRKVIIIGGGAAGLAAAIASAENGAETTVLEAAKKPGRKITLSGNGRCNLSNTAFPEHMYHGSDPAFAEQLLRDNREMLTAFFRSCGIVTRTVGTGIYPYSEEAPSVLENFLSRAEALGVRIRNNTPCVGIEREGEHFLVHTPSWKYEADRVILACGSPAFAEKGSTGGNGYGLASSLGHSVKEPIPALVPVVLRGGIFPKWAGARARGVVKLLCDGEELLRSEGQIQFTKYGISGIPVMDVSGTAARCLAEGRKVSMALDLMPELALTEAENLLRARKQFGTGILPAKVAAVLASYPYVTDDPSGLAKRLKGSEWEVESVRPMSEAQCASGGIPVQETDRRTMESVFVPGLYLTGEMLDIDGICGGYNLSFAFLTGICAGRSAADD
ncbi:MAG: aminoacetone oxidase family FAD-binding enzyme [Lachnospiraceae bacterium]|nr:aminoacetone oxidase family FAD-binding enzyme [Lachnospiraceae bacterium]